VLADWTGLMYRQHGALHHMDVLSGATVYRVFLLASTLQVDIAFAPEAEFGAILPTFRLIFGPAVDRAPAPAPGVAELIGLDWLYALHARSSIARGRAWQAEYMISGVRDHMLALACLRHGLPAVQGRGMDRLPPGATAAIAGALVRSLDLAELGRAFLAAAETLPAERGRLLVPGGRLADVSVVILHLRGVCSCGPVSSRLVLSYPPDRVRRRSRLGLGAPRSDGSSRFRTPAGIRMAP
jgi:hypothetical protein